MKTDLINLARQQIFEEYIAKRQKDFDEWMIKADIAWREERVKLPYPAFSVYPENEEIYARIEVLHKKLGENDAKENDTKEKVVSTYLVENPDEKNQVKTEVETKLPILLKKRKDKL